MKNLYKKIESLVKKICLIIIIVSPSSTLLAEKNEKKWTISCVDDNNLCIMIIVKNVAPESKERILTVYIANEKK